MFCVAIWEDARDLENVIRICPQSLASLPLRLPCLSCYSGETTKGMDPDLNSEKKNWLQEMGRGPEMRKVSRMVDKLYLRNIFCFRYLLKVLSLIEDFLYIWILSKDGYLSFLFQLYLNNDEILKVK